MVSLLPLLITASLSAAASTKANCPSLEVSQAWSRIAPVGPPRVGYVMLKNPHPQVIKIEGVRSNDFGAVEMHETVTRDGVSRMQRLSSIDVPAGGRVHLQPGGKHFMLFRAAAPAKVGKTFKLELQICPKQMQTIEFTIHESNPFASP